MSSNPAFPCPKRIEADPGLSKREYIAAHLLASLVTDKKTMKSKVTLAVEAADLLLKTLEDKS